MTADGCGWPWNFLRLNVRGNCRRNCLGIRRTSVVIAADFRGDCRVAMAMAADSCGNCHGSFRGNCRDDGRGLPWVDMVGTTEFATGRTTARAVATTVAFSVEAPRAVALAVETRGLARGNTHRSPQKFRGHCRGPPLKVK